MYTGVVRRTGRIATVTARDDGAVCDVGHFEADVLARYAARASDVRA